MRLNKLLVALAIPLFISSQALYAIQTAYITTGATIQVVNLSTNTVTRSFTVTGASNLTSIVVSPNDNVTAYVADSTSNRIYVVNLITQATTQTIDPGITISSSYPNLTITPDGNYLYVPALNTGTSFAVINTTTFVVTSYTANSMTHSGPIVIAPDGKTAYMGNLSSSSGNQVGIIPLTSSLPTGGTATPVNSVISVTALAGTLIGVESLGISPDSTTLYVMGPTLSNEVVAPITGLPSSPSQGTALLFSTGNQIRYSVVSPTTLYAQSSSSTFIINRSNPPTITATIAVGGGSALTLAVNGDETLLYVPSNAPNFKAISLVTNSTTFSTTSFGGVGIALSAGTPGSLDTTFGNQGITLTPISRQDKLQNAVLQTGNKIITTGITQTIGGSPATLSPSAYIAQYTSSGILDTANFNSSGTTPGIQTLLVGSRSESNAAALDASNKILVAGFCTQPQTSILLARYLSTGVIDTSFNTVGYTTQSIGEGVTANAVGVQSATQSNKIIVGGASINSGISNFALARFTTAGALDTTFGVNGITLTSVGNMSSITALAIITAATNKDFIIAVGNVDNKIAIARYNASGVLDTTFGTSGIFQPVIAGASSSKAYDVMLDTSSNILVAGSANISGTNESLLIRCTPSGAFDTTFNTTGYITQAISGGSEFYSVTLQSNAQIIAGGYAIGVLTNQISLARYSSAGAIDIGFGSNGIALATNGSTAYANTVLFQTGGGCVTAGTADATVFLARFTTT